MPKGVYKRTEKHKKQISKTEKGYHNSPKTEFEKGYHNSPKTEFKKGYHASANTEFKKGEFRKGGKLFKKGCKPFSTSFKKGEWRVIRKRPERAGKKHWNWQNGSSFEPYGIEFNEDLREVIRNRDRRKCQICGKTELENKAKLSVHHIDYNKRNNNPNNLISLCNSCHMKTNSKRNYWKKYFLFRTLEVGGGLTIK